MAHKLKPVVMLGNAGLSSGVLGALEEALLKHELIKVKVASGDRGERDEIIQQMVASSEAELIQRIGNIATLYRRNPEKPVIEI